MTKFIIKTIIFTVAFFFVSIILNLLFNNYKEYSINEIFTQKKKYLIENHNQFNTIIIGSSRLYRQLNPHVINEELKDYNISCFNLAAPATFNPELYILYEDLLKNNKLTLRYAFLEITDLNVIALKNLFTLKSYYLADWSYLLYSFNYINDSGRPFTEKVYFYITYGVTFLLNQIIPPDVNRLTKEIDPDPIRPLGYYSLNDELKSGTEDEINFIQNRKNQFENDTSELSDRIISAKRAFSSDNDHKKKINETHIKKLNYLIELSEKKGVELYFIIPPVHKDYDEIADLRFALPENRIIILADYNKYSELYTSKYMFDIGHLNEKGSSKLSEYLSVEFRHRLIDEDKSFNPDSF